MNEQEQQINTFLVDVFNDVLRLEEASIVTSRHPNLSVSEMHVLEAVQKHSEAPGTMRQLALRLGVTASSLTIAVKTLEQKGYLVRQKNDRDKRRVSVHLTGPALEALQSHAAFHEQLIRQVSRTLTAPELEALCQALGRLHRFFTTMVGPVHTDGPDREVF